jgi:arylsulfatase A-like enzyme
MSHLRNLSRVIRVIVSLVVAASVCGQVRSAEAEAKPNFIYILLDDAGYGDFSCYGQQKFQTPNIDRMAAGGLRFTDHYSGATVCAPSRCSLMTGLHGGHTFIRGNREIQPEGQYPIPAETVTLPELLKEAGYVTGAFGKWGLGPPGSEGDPLKQGFDEFFGYNCQRHAHSYYPTYLWHNSEQVPLDGKTYTADLISEQARDFIRRHKEGPFFCYMPVTVPHAALHVPEESAAAFRKEFLQFEETIGRYAGPQIKNPAACFAGMMTRLDGEIGRLLELLDELGIAEQTLVTLTSDNGAHREGGHMPDFFESTGPLRGIKRDLYEGGIRVPMIARWPGKIRPGTVTDHPSAFWDVLPTLCELAGAEIPQNTDGISMVPTLLGQADRQRKHEFLYWEFPPHGGKQAVRMGQWKGVRLNVRKNPDAPIELYDLNEDPGETRNVAADHPDVVARMVRVMKTARTESELFSLFE